MGNGLLKPAYNLQHGVDPEYVTWLTIGPQLTDTTTLIPFLKGAEEHLKFKYKNITADAGTESDPYKGIVYRMNRSIQTEGSFGDIKQDMQFRRYVGRGTSNVLAESILLVMARNLNKLHNKIQKGRTGSHMFPLKSA